MTYYRYCPICREPYSTPALAAECARNHSVENTPMESKEIYVSLPPDTVAALDAQSAREHVTRTVIARRAIEHYVAGLSIPQRIAVDLAAYRMHRPVTGWLRDVLDGRLRMAVLGADPDSLAALPRVIRYLHEELPANAWGSPEAVQEWLAMTPVEINK